MRRLLHAIAFSLLLFGSARASWSHLEFPELQTSLPVWKPRSFDPAKSYPAIIYYHGTNGRPNVSLMHEMTGGQEFVLVGMSYRQRGRYPYSDEQINDTLGLLSALRKTLVQSFSINPKRIYVGGFSKGGWLTSMLLEHDPSLAGGLILGGGAFKPRAELPSFDKQKPVYIGCGRYDGNYPQSLAALIHFRKRGAEVTIEAWSDVGHAHPKAKPEGLRQWLRLQARPLDLKQEAHDWVGKRWEEIRNIEDPVEKWFACQEFRTLPFVLHFGHEAALEASESSSELLELPVVANEKKWQDALRAVLSKECQDRLVDTLQAASSAYSDIAEQARGTRAGHEATRDHERTKQMLNTIPARRKQVDP